VRRAHWSSVLSIALAAGCGESASDGATAPDAATPDAAVPDAAVDPYAAWPDPESVFPYVYSPDPDAPAYAHVRWETEDWNVGDSPQTVQYLQKVTRHYRTAPPEVVQHFQAAQADIPPLGGGVRLSFAGDILYVGDNWSHFAEGAEPVNHADVRVANLELAASSLSPSGRMGVPTRYNAPVEVLDHLPFDLLQLTNNHVLDADDAGALATRDEAERRGYQTAGVERQATLTVQGKKVAFLAYTWGVNRRDYETTVDVHRVPFCHLDVPVDLTRVKDDIAAARADGADYVVTLLHWGYEFEWYPDPHFLQLARQIVASGADVIAAEGPHVVQPAELCWVNHPEVVPGIGTCSVRSDDGRPRRAAVFYSLGDFTNDQPDLIQVLTGIVGKVTLDGDVTGMGWTPVKFELTPPHTVPAEDLAGQDADLAAELTRLDHHLGTGWKLVRGEKP
jgi:hypothetical protein